MNARRVAPPRSAKAAGDAFPYLAKTTCYVEVLADGTVQQGWDEGTYERVSANESALYAVWPGTWSSDLFVIDDVEQFARAVGIVQDKQRTGLDEHTHDVAFTERPNGSGRQYCPVDVQLHCGCEIKDIRTFAKHMREQRGWDIATSKGWGHSGSTYSMHVRRTSLR